MKTKTRSAQRIKQEEKLQNNLLDLIGINRTLFLATEFEYGCKLLENYMEGLNDVAYAEPFKKELLTNKNHVYWPWFINQKRRFDHEFLGNYKEYGHFKKVVAGGRLFEEYLDDFNAWIKQDGTHHLLRHFIKNSKTLYI